MDRVGGGSYASPAVSLGAALIVGIGRGNTSGAVTDPRDGALVALDAATGDRSWHIDFRDAVATPPIATDRGLLVLSSDPSIFCD